MSRSFDSHDEAVFLRCDQPAVARRQLEMSIGLVVVLLVATLIAMVAAPMLGPTAESQVATLEAPLSTGKIVHAAARVIPMYKIQALEQTRIGKGG
jgi:membrane protein YdbS with pleckstrin-like domain